MTRTSLMAGWVALWLAMPLAAAAEAPAVVTTARGDVQLLTGDAAAALPPLPVILAPGQSLQLADGAMAVVLCGGQATKFSGPETVGLDRLRRSGTEEVAASGVLSELLGRQSSTARPAASRGLGGELSLQRPVPWTSVLSLASIRWSCEGCGTQKVQVYDFRADEVVWEGAGEGAIEYPGPALKPGAYYVVLAGRDFPFTVPPAEDRTRVEGALDTLGGAGDDLKEPGLDASLIRLGLEVAVLVAAEMPTEALYRIDAALLATPDDVDLLRLRTDVESQAGLTP